jgi:hypothetical protein
MNTSQTSMDTFLGRFENAITLLQNDNDYQPSKVDIQKAALIAFVTQLRQSTNTVNLLKTNLKTLRTQRTNLAFKYMSDTPDTTLEAIMVNVINYLGAENGQDNSVYKAIKDYMKKIRPKVKSTKEDGSRGPSRSEKTYTALASYFENTVHLLTNSVGLIYNPSNPNLKIANLTALSNTFSQLNRDIAAAERDEQTARQERQELFKGDRGANNLAKDIKMYLSSYEGGKNNAKYMQFVGALTQ